MNFKLNYDDNGKVDTSCGPGRIGCGPPARSMKR